MEENKTNINCKKPIYINIDSNHWKYWLFNIEIFTFLLKVKNYKREVSY